MTRDVDDEQWGTDAFFFTEAARGGPLTWRVGGAGFEGDELGPVRHVHDDAAEYYYMVTGAIHVEVGGEEFVLGPGELCCIPPDAPHNVLGLASDEDARMLCIVAPNVADAKWRISDFRPGSESLRAVVGRPFVDEELPASGTVTATALVLAAGEQPRVVVPQGHERVYLVVEGALDLALHGGLHGSIAPGTYVHVREGMRHELSTSSSCRVLRIDCAHDNWAGVPRAESVSEGS